MRKGEFSHHTHITHSPRCSHTRLKLDYLKQEGELAGLSSPTDFSLSAMSSNNVQLGPLWVEIYTIPLERYGGAQDGVLYNYSFIVEVGLIFYDR